MLIAALHIATMPAGMSLLVRRHLADIMTVKPKVTRREVAVAGLHSFPCNRIGTAYRLLFVPSVKVPGS